MAIIHKDLVQEMRARDVLSSMFLFSMTAFLIFSFITDTPVQSAATRPGILWITFTFASTLGLNRSFSRELENGMVQGMRLCPVDAGLVFVARACANVIFLTVLELIAWPVFIILFDLTPSLFFSRLLIIFLLGNIGIATVGTLFSAIAAQSKSKEMMLPLLMLPIIVPVILAAIKSTSIILVHQQAGQASLWIRLLVVFDLIYSVAGTVLYEYVIEE